MKYALNAYIQKTKATLRLEMCGNLSNATQIAYYYFDYYLEETPLALSNFACLPAACYQHKHKHKQKHNKTSLVILRIDIKSKKRHQQKHNKCRT